MLLLSAFFLAGCSDQIENENTALKAQNHAFCAQRKSDEMAITTLTNSVNALQEKIRDMQISDLEQIADQKRTISSLSADSIRQKEDIENLRRAMADQKALFDKYKEDVTEQLQRPGRVKVTLFYKENGAGPSVPDNNASVSLHLIKDTTVAYRQISSTDGVAVLDRVKPGRYLCVIHSGNAHQRLRAGGAALVRQRIWKTDRTMLSSYLDDAQIKLLDHDLSDSDASGHFLEALLAKTYVQEIDVKPQDDLTVKYDFGLGAF